MGKTCFVIMGFGIKDNINLDLTYNKIIKPCIIANNLLPFPLYEQAEYNAYRCDEISGTVSIDYKFVTCLSGSDIVIADISTMNANAIYELGARHALKPRSTILLCAKDKEREFKFFDLTYVPIIFYSHDGLQLSSKTIAETKQRLNSLLDFAINSTTSIPDNPIQRALNESQTYSFSMQPPNNVYQLYTKGRTELDNNDYEQAEETLKELYIFDPSEETLLLLVLAKYKNAENAHSCKKLIECISFVKEHIDVDASTSEHLWGRLAAICLRIFIISGNPEYYYTSTEYYRRGANYSKKNLYCPRNYCAMLLRVHEVTDDPQIISEYYYTAKHYAKLFLNCEVDAKRSGSYEQRIYLFYNTNDLRSIISGEYLNFEKNQSRLESDPDISARQRETIMRGMEQLKNDIDAVNRIIRSSSC